MLECGRHPQKGAAQNLKGWYKALEDLVWLTQLGLNMLLPLVLCLAGCWWAVEHWGWPEWLFLPAVGLGLAAGAQNFWVFCKERLERSKHLRRVSVHCRDVGSVCSAASGGLGGL